MLIKANNWSEEFNDFVNGCLLLDPHSRSSVAELMQVESKDS